MEFSTIAPSVLSAITALAVLHLSMAQKRRERAEDRAAEIVESEKAEVHELNAKLHDANTKLIDSRFRETSHTVLQTGQALTSTIESIRLNVENHAKNRETEIEATVHRHLGGFVTRNELDRHMSSVEKKFDSIDKKLDAMVQK